MFVSSKSSIRKSGSLLIIFRAAKKYSRKGIINAHQLLHKEMFVSCITFSFFPEQESGVMGVIG